MNQVHTGMCFLQEIASSSFCRVRHLAKSSPSPAYLAFTCYQTKCQSCRWTQIPPWVTNSLEYCVTKFSLILQCNWWLNRVLGLTIALCGRCCWKSSILQTHTNLNTQLNLAAADTSSQTHLLPSALPIHAKLQPVRQGMPKRPLGSFGLKVDPWIPAARGSV